MHTRSSANRFALALAAAAALSAMTAAGIVCVTAPTRAERAVSTYLAAHPVAISTEVSK